MYPDPLTYFHPVQWVLAWHLTHFFKSFLATARVFLDLWPHWDGNLPQTICWMWWNCFLCARQRKWGPLCSLIWSVFWCFITEHFRQQQLMWYSGSPERRYFLYSVTLLNFGNNLSLQIMICCECRHGGLLCFQIFALSPSTGKKYWIDQYLG